MMEGRGSAAAIDAPIASRMTTLVTRLDGAVETARGTPPALLGEVLAADAMSREAFEGTGMSLVEELARPWSRIWLAREEASAPGRQGPGDPVGFLLAWHVADELHILNIATARTARRRGVATALLSHGLAYARENAIRILILEVRRSNHAAIALYRKLSFTVLGVRSSYYSDNGEDAIEMILGLDPATGAPLPGSDEIRIDG